MPGCRILVFALAASACVACGQRREPVPRALLIGIDGASPRVVLPLLKRGSLPALSRMAVRGFYAPLRSFMPLFSPVVWTTIATGREALAHGIVGFTKTGDDGQQTLLLGSDRKVHALWNIASDAGRRVAVVNWWNTYPPEKIDGVVISDHAIPGEVERRRALTGAASVPRAASVYPEHWQARLAELFVEEAPLTDFPNPFSGDAGLPGFVDVEALARTFRTDALIARIALAVEAELRPDLMLVFLPGIDRVSHRLWGNLEPEEAYPERLRPTPDQRAAGRRALFGYYAYTDTLIGLLVERFGEDDLVMVVSDHGFAAGVTKDRDLTGSHATRDARFGVVFARGRGVRPGPAPRRVTIKDVTPTVLAWLGLPVARDMAGAPAPFLDAELLAPVDTYETRAIERVETAPSPAADEIVEQLRELGYLE